MINIQLEINIHMHMIMSKCSADCKEYFLRIHPDQCVQESMPKEI